MEQTISMKVLKLLWFFGGLFFVYNCFANVTYIPASDIAMTGSNNEVFFDIEDDRVNAGASVPGPKLSTITKTFSGAFYLSGAGWVDMGASGYEVSLDCGAQTIDDLTAPCLITGTGYSETIGDIVFGGNVIFHPGSGLLFGTASTLIGEYVFDGIALPLLPSIFREGSGSVAHNAVALSISGSSLFGDGPWSISFTPLSTTEIRNLSPSSSFSIDLSLAADYDVEITDPQGSTTNFLFKVVPDIPSFVLAPGVNFRSYFCNLYLAHSYCQDGAVQNPSELIGVSGAKVANASDTFIATLTFRDRYGNEVKEGDVSIVYRDTIRTFQVNTMNYLNFDDYCARNIDNFCSLITGGLLLGNDDGTPEVIHAPVLGGFSYTIAARAPTGVSDTLSLSGIVYRDPSGIEYDITEPALRTPFTFTPWYTSSLSSGPIMVGETTDFIPVLANATPAIHPDTYVGIYQINIGSNTRASYTDYQGDNIICNKYIAVMGSDACNWVTIPDTTIVATWGNAFSGIYSPYSSLPGPESVTYLSYVRYTQGGTTVIYPSQSASLGIATAGTEYMKILGQDTTPFTGIGVEGTFETNEWNSIKKKVSLKSRGRVPTSGYADVDYIVHTGSITVGNADIHGSPEKRAIVVIGGNITINTDIAKGVKPTLLVALMDNDGNGGEIIIEPSVRDLSTSLFAEKSIHSSGNMQLYIFGNVFSHNTLSNVECPYYVTGVCDPTLYNLEQIRADYAELVVKTGHTASSPRAADYPNIPLIIEYDGRLLQDPPVILEN